MSARLGEPISLPTRLLAMSTFMAAMVPAGLLLLLLIFKSIDEAALASGMVGVGLVAIMSAAGILVMTPWRRRLVIDWMPLWLASTVFRMLGTPTVAYVLYSAPWWNLAAKPLGLAVALTYLATLFVEAVVLSQFLKRSCPLPSTGTAGT